MKINKIRLKFHFLTKIEIKMTYLVFFFLVFYCFFASRAIWKPFYRSLRYLVVAEVYKPENPSKKLRGYMLLVVLKIRIMGFLSGFLSEFLPKFLSVTFGSNPDVCPISCLISCQFHVRFLSDSSFVLLSVFVGRLENEDLKNEVELK